MGPKFRFEQIPYKTIQMCFFFSTYALPLSRIDFSTYARAASCSALATIVFAISISASMLWASHVNYCRDRLLLTGKPLRKQLFYGKAMERNKTHEKNDGELWKSLLFASPMKANRNQSSFFTFPFETNAKSSFSF